MAVLLDPDGVLVGSLAAYREAWKQWALRHELPGDAAWSLARGRRPADVIRLIDENLDLPAELDSFAGLLGRELRRTRALPGARELLSRLRPDGHAIVTSAFRWAALQALGSAGLPARAVLVAGEDVAAGKPDPECYLLAALRLQSEAHRCIVVEDAAEGVAAPKAAGMRVIVVGRHGEQPGLAKADHVVMSLEEVIADLEGWSLL